MKKTNVHTVAIGTFLLITIFAFGGFFAYKKGGERLETYANNTYGVSFQYPKKYELTEQRLSEGGGMMITLLEKSIGLPENGEGPTAITIGIYEHAAQGTAGKTPSEEWIATSPSSNFKLSQMTTPGATQIGNQDGYLYTWDGLYQGTTVVTQHAGNIFAFTVTYDGDTDMEKREDFTDIVASVEFMEPGTAATTTEALYNTPKEATLTGTYECAPRKGDGPHDLMCSFGIKADNGNHYALDLSDIQQELINTGMETKITVTGTLVPIEYLSSDKWQTYDIKGIMKVKTFTKA